MGTPADTIPFKTAAKMLGVTPGTIYRMVQQGALTAVPRAGGRIREQHFRTHDVAALAEARSKPRKPAALLAEQAIALSKSNARRLDELCRVLGLDVAVLETSEEAIVALYLKAEEMQLGERMRVRENPKEILEWARAIYAIDENYLSLVHHFTAIEEPWDVFLRLAQRLCEEAPHERFALHKELEHAYGYLEAARRSIRHVAFFYNRQKTTRIKDARFDEKEDYAEPIIRLLFPH